MKAQIVLYIILLMSLRIYGQPYRFSVGLDGSVKTETYTFNDPGGRLAQGLGQLQARWGLTARWYMSRHWTAETGLSFAQVNAPTIDYVFPVSGRRVPFYNQQGSRPQFLVRAYYAPLQIAFRHYDLEIGPYVGGAFMTHRVNTEIFSVPGLGFSRDYPAFTLDPTQGAVEVISSRRVTANPSRVSTYAELGGHMSIFWRTRWHIRYQVGWHQGFTQTSLTQVTYQSSFNPGVTNNATITSNGSGWSANLMFAYRFGN